MVSWPGARVKYFPRTAMVGSARGNRGGVVLAERGRDIECLAEKG
jgi:DNA-binding IscR family transcriptional regulator